MKRISPLPLAAAILTLLIPNSPSAASFQDAIPHIDLDGSILGYVNFEDDGQEIGTALNDIYQQVITHTPEMPPIPVDFTQLLDNLGFSSLNAVAFSSKDLKDGQHRNRSVALMNGSPTGIYALYSLSPLTFSAAQKAPADATGAMTTSVQLTALRDTATSIMQQIMGPMGESLVKQQLMQVIPGTDLSYDAIINTLSGKWDAFWHQSYRENLQQEFKFWVSIEGAGSLLPKLRNFAETQGVTFSENDTTLKANFGLLLGANAAFSLYAEAPKQGGELIIYSHPDWTPQSPGERLASTPAFQQLAAQLPAKAIAFNYSVGADLKPLLEQFATMPQLAKYSKAAESLIELLIGDFLKPSMTVTYMAGEHIATDQYAGYSSKQVIMALPTLAASGIGAAMAIPAFQKVRTTSQEKAVTNNLRQIAAAADQYFLENGKTSVNIKDLIGPDKYLRSITPVAGESYEGMTIEMDTDISVTLGNGKVITLDF
ncbi:hypothetical protein QEH59_10615 [Coraliomargarita sp. SDUM461004]|uniref:Uncharacterized protein n=1 Tax=Thalassobacterium sedimentorum TaxID=3041258 RepID=A0ABU1AJA8_9BACT|nr:hypothetical protein [Coraliomargarita sp. SDUM461004]MDQ8194880.1 hypothetical protein [Coraliomargarita sp. SDUM461004]